MSCEDFYHKRRIETIAYEEDHDAYNDLGSNPGKPINVIEFRNTEIQKVLLALLMKRRRRIREQLGEIDGLVAWLHDYANGNY